MTFELQKKKKFSQTSNPKLEQNKNVPEMYCPISKALPKYVTERVNLLAFFFFFGGGGREFWVHTSPGTNTNDKFS